jgi:nitrate reductase gamma subunit
MKTQFLFAVCPYIALAMVIVGTIATSLLGSQAEPAIDLSGAGRSWRTGLIVLLLGHAAGFLFPRGVLAWNARPARLYLMEASGFVAGVCALWGWTRMMRRHLSQSSAPVGRQVAEALFLSLVFSSLVSGLLAAGLYRWSTSWSVVTVTPYVRSVLRGRPLAELAGEMPFLVQLHAFCAFGLLALLPFTRSAAVLVHAVRRGMRFVLAPVPALMRETRAKFDPSGWLWPEED